MHSPDSQAARIGRSVRVERERQGLRQEELALVAGVSVRSVHQIETGKATSRLDIVTRVLDALGLRLDVVSVRYEPESG